MAIKNIVKKIVIPVFVLLLIFGGVFYWQNNQKDIQGLNKTLPAGIRVEKSICGFAREYKVINKIDGYEFKVPSAWKGIKDIIYTPERTEQGYTGASIELEGNAGVGRSIGVDQFKAGNNIAGDLESWVKLEFTTFGLVGDFTEAKIDEFDVVKTQENIHFGGEYVYYFGKNKFIYSLTGPSEEFIREIIANGKW